MTVTCSTQPSRIDFNFSPSPAPEDVSSPSSLSLIENQGKLYSELLSVTSVIGNGVVSDSIDRVALNVQFLAVQPAISAANKTLMDVIPSEYGLKITNEEDFVLQINRPYVLREVDEIKMNAITKWSVDRIQIVTISIPMGIPASGPRAGVALDSHQTDTFTVTAASVTFDNNNVSTGAPLSSAQQSSLLREALTAAGRMQWEIGLKIEGFRHASLPQ